MHSVLIAMSEYITQNLGTNLFVKTGAFITNIAPVFSMGFGLYVVILAFYYYNRGLDESILDLTKKTIGWLLIIAFAFNAKNYAYLANLFYGLPEAMAGWFSGKEVNASVIEASVGHLNKSIASLDKLIKDASWYELQLQFTVFLAKVVVYFCGTVLVSFVFFFYLIAKLCLALTLMVGPLFIGAALFPATRQYAMNWLAQILNFAVTVTLYSVIFVLQTSFVEAQLEKWGTSGIKNIAGAYEVASMMVILTILFIIVVLSIPSITSALTGGAGVDGHGRTMGRLGANAIGAGKFVSRLAGSLRSNGMKGN